MTPGTGRTGARPPNPRRADGAARSTTQAGGGGGRRRPRARLLRGGTRGTTALHPKKNGRKAQCLPKNHGMFGAEKKGGIGVGWGAWGGGLGCGTHGGAAPEFLMGGQAQPPEGKLGGREGAGA